VIKRSAYEKGAFESNQISIPRFEVGGLVPAGVRVGRTRTRTRSQRHEKRNKKIRHGRLKKRIDALERMRARRSYEGGNSAMTGFDPRTNICKFTTYFFEGVDLDPALTAGHTINFGGIINVYYSATTTKVPVVQLYYTAPFVRLSFTQFQTRQVDEFVCDVLRGPGCMDELGDQAEQGLTKQVSLYLSSTISSARNTDNTNIIWSTRRYDTIQVQHRS